VNTTCYFRRNIECLWSSCRSMSTKTETVIL